MISKRKRILVVGMLAGILAIFLVLAGVFIVQFKRYRTSGGSESIDPTLPQVSINIPTGDNTFIVGQPSPVNALAIGYDPFLSMELWVDGLLAGVDAGPSGGMTPFSGEFLWIPTQPGLHQLIARAKDSAQHVTSSAGLMVIVMPDEAISASTSAGENVTGSESSVPIVYPAAGSNSQPPAPPGPDATSGPSQPWEGSPEDWFTSLTAGEPPSAPELVAAPVACGATLAIHDLSDNEEGFIVYRQKLYAPGWTQAAALASQSQNEWILFGDTGMTGAVSYYVLAFNSQGEAVSNIVTVLVPMEILLPGEESTCNPASNDLPLLAIDLTSLIPKFDVDQAYCYHSLGGFEWSRLPEMGFFTTQEGGFQVNESVAQILLNDPEGQPIYENKMMEIKLDCWGWIGNELKPLGTFTQSFDPAATSKLPFDLEGLSGEIKIDIAKLSDFPPPVQMLPNGSGGPFNGFDFPSSLKPPIPESTQMPFISAWITYDPDFCTAHLEPEAQNVLGSLLLCQPYPGYNIGPGGIKAQPYLVWFLLNNTCSAGFNKDCLSYSWWQGFVKSNNGTMGFTVDDYFDPNGYMTWDITKPYRTVWTVNPFSDPISDSDKFDCPLGQRLFRVQMYVDVPGYNSYYGPPSNWVTMPCVKPLGDQVLIEVTFDVMLLSNLDDDDTDTTGCIGPESCDDVEVYGTLGARPSSTQNAEAIVLAQLANCTNPEMLSAMDPGGSLGCLLNLGAGSHPLSLFRMCADIAWDSVTNTWKCKYPDGYKQYSNKVLLTVQNGDAVKLAANLMDDDTSSSDDPVCITSLWTEPKPLLQWAQTTDEIYHLSASHENANCQVDVILNAVNP